MHFETPVIPAKAQSCALRQPAAQAFAKLNWTAADGKRAGPPDYPIVVTPEGGWTRLTLDATAPENASAMKLQLL
jgi:hypothetical protein